MNAVQACLNCHFILLFLIVESCGKSSVPTEETKTLPVSEVSKPTVTRENGATVATDSVPASVPVTPLPTPKTYFGDLGRLHVTAPVAFAPPDRGSAVLIVVDALNVRHLGAYGYERNTSPRIDAFSKQSLMLTNYIANSSWTRPSFSTIITGLTKQQHKVELNGNTMREEIVTVAERFRSAGYHTAAFVGNPLLRQIWGFGQGFRTYEDTKSLGKAFAPDRVLADKAMQWLERVGDTPFYLMVFFTAPHVPYRPPAIYRDFLKQAPEGPVIEYPFREYTKPLSEADQARIVAAYDGEVQYVDSQIGRIIDYLKRTHRLDRTSVIVTADHGELFGRHNCYVHSWHMWEQALRVPFLLYAPGLSQAAGLIDDRPFTHADIAPTLLHLAGLNHDIPDHMGVSIVDRLAEPLAGRNRPLFSQYNAHGVRRQAVRRGPLKLIHHHAVSPEALKHVNSLHPDIPSGDPASYPSLALDGERYELYDLVEDPDEVVDLFAERKGSAALEELMGTLDSVVSGATVRPTAPTLPDETLEALRNAGYIQ